MTERKDPKWACGMTRVIADDGIFRKAAPVFDMLYADKIVLPFERLNCSGEHEGTRIGLAIVQRMSDRLAGLAWAVAEVGFLREHSRSYKITRDQTAWKMHVKNCGIAVFPVSSKKIQP